MAPVAHEYKSAFGHLYAALGWQEERFTRTRLVRAAFDAYLLVKNLRAQIEKLEERIRQLEKDRRRLNWLDKHADTITDQGLDARSFKWFPDFVGDVRDAIDCYSSPLLSKRETEKFRSALEEPKEPKP